MKRGIGVECVVCYRRKAPRGRSVTVEMADSLCSHGNCSGYWASPYPGDLWPGETEEEFGYPVSPNATEHITKVNPESK